MGGLCCVVCVDGQMQMWEHSVSSAGVNEGRFFPVSSQHRQDVVKRSFHHH